MDDCREPARPCCSDRSSKHGRSTTAASRFLADSPLRSADSTAHTRIVAWAFCRSLRCISCRASQCEAVHGVRWVKRTGRRSAEVVSAVRIVPVALYLFRWNGNVLAVFPASCVDVAVNVLDLSRVAVRLVATADGRIVGHVPFRIKLFMQELILCRMVPRRVASILLRLDSHCQ